MAIDPHEPDAETRRKISRTKGQRSVDAMHKVSGFEAALADSKSPTRPYETPRQRQARERAEERGEANG